MEFKIHKIKWDNEKIKRFRDYLSSKKDESYFSKVLGGEIIDLVNKHVKIKGLVLDYGCGPGFLIKFLLDKGYHCTGIDFSKGSVDITNGLFINNKGYILSIVVDNLPIESLSDNRFGCVFLLEAIEHFLSDQTSTTIKEIYRLLVPGGYIVVTTQNNEDIMSHEMMCPDCGCVFHRMQHMNSFDVSSLSKIMNSNGFEREYCKALNFREGSLESKFKNLYENLMSLVKKPSVVKKNLIYIGRKK